MAATALARRGSREPGPKGNAPIFLLSANTLSHCRQQVTQPLVVFRSFPVSHLCTVRSYLIRTVLGDRNGVGALPRSARPKLSSTGGAEPLGLSGSPTLAPPETPRKPVEGASPARATPVASRLEIAPYGAPTQF